MPPKQASPKPAEADSEQPRLDIDEEGTARAVFSDDWKTKHHQTMEKNNAGRMATAEDGTAQALAPNGNNQTLQFELGALALDPVHLRVGRHEISDLRTRLVEPALPAEVERDPMVIDDDEAIRASSQPAFGLDADTSGDETAFPGPGFVASAGIETALQAPDLTPIPTPWQAHAVLPPHTSDTVEQDLLNRYPWLQGTEFLQLLARGGAIRAPDYLEARAQGLTDFPVTIVHQNAEENILGYIDLRNPHFPPVQVPWRPSGIPEYATDANGGPRPQPGLTVRRAQEAQQEMVAEPAPPSVVFMKLADRDTRLRRDSEVLIIKGEKYIRLGETHFLYAVNVEYLLEGEDTTLRRHAHLNVSRPEQSGNATRPGTLLEPENGRPQAFRPQCDIFGRVALNAEDRPLRFSPHMPYRVSTEVEGWEIEALSRLDPDLCHHDFIDRMLPNMALGGGKFRPSGRTLEQRRRGE